VKIVLRKISTIFYSLSIISIIILSLIPLASIYYLRALETNNTRMHSLRTGRQPFDCNVGQWYSGYFLASKGDKISFDVSVSGAPWVYNITVIDLLNNRNYTYSRTYYSIRALTPEFIVPESGFYRYVLFVKVLDSRKECKAGLTISGVQQIRYDVINNTPYYVLILLFSILLVEFLIRKTRVSSKFYLVKWEFRYMMAWIFFVAVIYTYAFFYVSFPSAIDESEDIVLTPIRIGKRPNYIIIYALLAATIASMLYTYSWEARFDRTTDLLPLKRTKKFLSRLLIIFITLYVPIVIVTSSVYLLWIPKLFFREFFIKLYLYELLHYLIVLFFILSFILLPAVIIPRVNIALILETLPLLTLYLYPVIPRSLYIIDLKRLVRINIPWFMRYIVPDIHLYVREPGDILKHEELVYIFTYTILFVLVVILCMFIYRRREAP